MRLAVRALSAALAMLLAALSLLVAIELALAAFGREHWLIDWQSWQEFGRTHVWSDGPVRLLASAVLAAGILALVLAFWPRRPAVLPLTDGSDEHPRVHYAIRRRSLGDALGRDVGAMPGVTVNRARVRRRGLGVLVSSRNDQDATDARVRDRVMAFQSRLGLRHLREPAVSVQQASPTEPRVV